MRKLAIVTSVLIIIGVLLVAGLGGLRLGLRYLFLGRFTLPTTQDFVAIAQRNQYIVQAVYDYRAEHGLWPQGFGDLIPRYLATRPSDPLTQLDDDSLSIHAGVPHTCVCYFFRQNEGWSANGDFGTGSLPLPKGTATRPAVTGDDLVRARLDDLVRARLAEYDRRIGHDSDMIRVSSVHRTLYGLRS